MDDEKITELIEGVVKTLATKVDSQWDRDARMFTARRMRNAITVEDAREAARIGAAAADALQEIRGKPIDPRGMS
jgi:hypothetical protein